MNRIRLLLAYDGAAFKGWQSQPCGNTVQDHVEQVVAGITGEAVRVHGSGRTDTGVHAHGPCVNSPTELCGGLGSVAEYL